MQAISYYSRVRDFIDRRPGLFDGLNQDNLEDFLNWLPNNCHVVIAFGKYAKELKQTGRRKYYSAYAIRERLRWDSLVSEIGTEYKISNNNTPFLARLIMEMDPALKGMFRTKKQVKYESL